MIVMQHLSSNKKGISTVVLVVIIVAIVGVASVAGYLVLKDNGNDNDSSVGEYVTYTVIGVGGATIYDGTFSIKIVEETDTKYKVEYSYALYGTTLGKRTAFYINSEASWEDKENYDSPGVKTGSETVSTKWGNKETEIYTKVIDGETTKAYIGKQDGIIYEIEMSTNGVDMFFVLTSTNLIKGNPGDGVGDYMVYSTSGSISGTVVDGFFFTMIVDQTATKYEVGYIYALYKTTLGVRTVFYVDSDTEWENIEDYESPGVKTGTDTLSTAWGSRNVDIYTKVIDGETTKTYVGHDDGAIYKMTMTMDGMTMTFTLVGTNLL